MLRDPLSRLVPEADSRTSAWLERRRAAVPRAIYNVTDIVAANGAGARVRDVDGREFLDFAGGLAALNVGRANPRVLAAIRAQVEQSLHECFHVAMYPGYVELAERLNALVPGDRRRMTMLANSGAEAVENAIKVARYTTGRPAIVACSHAFHGRTLLGMTLSALANPYRRGFGPLASDVHRAPYPYPYRSHVGNGADDCGSDCVERTAALIRYEIGADQVAAVIVEPVQAEGGIIVPPPGYLRGLRELCTQHQIVLIDDEVQAGMGRTGRLFAIEHFDVVPDIVVTAKSLGAGLPISAVTGDAMLMDRPHVGALGGTYGGNPVACAAALAVIEELTVGGLLEAGQRQGRLLRSRLDDLPARVPIVGEVRGLGPMIGIELVEDQQTKQPAPERTQAVLRRCHQQGLIILKAGVHGNVVRLLAPLVIDDNDLHRGIDIVIDAIERAGA
ncbi:MAG: 4-aminobutyrate--2-oxoglutarate transaminase [Egibacteraceae bacterium]